MKILMDRKTLFGLFLGCVALANTAQAEGIGEIIGAVLPSAISPQLSEGETDSSEVGKKVCITLGQRQNPNSAESTIPEYTTYRADSVIVPSSWNSHDCAGWAGGQFQLGCLFSTGAPAFPSNAVGSPQHFPKFSLGSENLAFYTSPFGAAPIPPAMRPPRNCGW